MPASDERISKRHQPRADLKVHQCEAAQQQQQQEQQPGQPEPELEPESVLAAAGCGDNLPAAVKRVTCNAGVLRLLTE